jgi:hypothetical protein
MRYALGTEKEHAMLKKPWSSLTLLLFLSVPPSLCDVVELKTGERLEGTFKQANSAGVVIESGGQPITMSLAKVRAIYFGAAPLILPARAPDAANPKRQQALQALNELRALTKVSSVTRRDYDLKLAEVSAKVETLFPIPPLRADGTAAADADTKLVWGPMLHYQTCSEVWAGAVLDAKLRFGDANSLVSPPHDCWDQASKLLDDALATQPAKKVD